MFKDLGFSLKEIKNMNSESIENKITSLKEQIKKAEKNIKTLQLMIRKEDNIMIDEFVNDADVIGKWIAIDYIDEIDIMKVFYKNNLFLQKIIFHKDGLLDIECKENLNTNYKWTSGKIIDDKHDFTCSDYTIIKHNNKQYLFFEWKNGDYIFGKRKPMYYVLLKI